MTMYYEFPTIGDKDCGFTGDLDQMKKELTQIVEENPEAASLIAGSPASFPAKLQVVTEYLWTDGEGPDLNQWLISYLEEAPQTANKDLAEAVIALRILENDIAAALWHTDLAENIKLVDMIKKFPHWFDAANYGDLYIPADSRIQSFADALTELWHWA